MNYEYLKKLFIIGIIASVITVIGGEIPIGWVVNPEAKNEILSMIMGYGSLSLPQLACGVFFGGIGIPLQYYGYRAISVIVTQNGNEKCGKFIDIGAKSIAFFGGIVHILCVALMFVVKTEMSQITDSIPENTLNFALWLVMPISAVFMIIYTIMAAAMFIAVVKGMTVFPKWAAVFNPMAVKILIPVISAFLPNTEIVNALNMADMGLGSLITFVGFYILLKNNHRKVIQENEP